MGSACKPREGDSGEALGCFCEALPSMPCAGFFRVGLQPLCRSEGGTKLEQILSSATVTSCYHTC